MVNDYSLDYCASMALADIGETSTRYKQKYVNYGIKIFRRLNLGGLMPTSKTVLLDIDTNTNTAILPTDYTQYLKVGLCRNGKFVNLCYNENICNTIQDGGADVCTDCVDQFYTDSNNVDCGCTGNMNPWYYYPYWYNGLYYGGVYGYGAGNYRGGFKVFQEQWKIALDSYITGEHILLEYMSNGMAGAGTVVPETAVGTIVAGIHLEAAIHNQDRKTRLDVVPYQRAFNAEYVGLRARHASLNLATWKETYLRSLRQTVKR